MPNSSWCTLTQETIVVTLTRVTSEVPEQAALHGGNRTAATVTIVANDDAGGVFSLDEPSLE